MPIAMPRRPKDPSAQLIPVLASAAGELLAGPAGAAVGNAAGEGAAAGMNPTTAGVPSGQQAGQLDAMQRRLDSSNKDDVPGSPNPPKNTAEPKPSSNEDDSKKSPWASIGEAGLKAALQFGAENESPEGVQGVDSQAGAMSRRMSQMDDDPQSVIHQALMHAVELPPEVRAEIGPMLLQAHFKAKGYDRDLTGMG